MAKQAGQAANSWRQMSAVDPIMITLGAWAGGCARRHGGGGTSNGHSGPSRCAFADHGLAVGSAPNTNGKNPPASSRPARMFSASPGDTAELYFLDRHPANRDPGLRMHHAPDVDGATESHATGPAHPCTVEDHSACSDEHFIVDRAAGQVAVRPGQDVIADRERMPGRSPQHRMLHDHTVGADFHRATFVSQHRAVQQPPGPTRTRPLSTAVGAIQASGATDGFPSPCLISTRLLCTKPGGRTPMSPSRERHGGHGMQIRRSGP